MNDLLQLFQNPNQLSRGDPLNPESRRRDQRQTPGLRDSRLPAPLLSTLWHGHRLLQRGPDGLLLGNPFAFRLSRLLLSVEQRDIRQVDLLGGFFGGTAGLSQSVVLGEQGGWAEQEG